MNNQQQPQPSFEQMMQMMQMMRMMQTPQPAPADAVTGHGIRNWWPIVAGFIAALCAVFGWVISGASSGAEKYTNMTNKLDHHSQSIEAKADKRDLEAIERKVNALTEDKADKRDLVAIRDKLDEVSKSNSEVRSSIAGLDSKFKELFAALNIGRGRVER